MKILVLDGNSIANRAFYGTPPLSNRTGQQTGAILSFFKSLHKLKQEHSPDAVCITFDEKAPTFRHLSFDDYKGKRKKMPEELSSQMVLLKEILSAMGIATFSMAGWEADDLMGTIAKLSQDQEWETILVTGDKDSLQLSTSKTTIHLITTTAKGPQVKYYTPQVFHDEYGFDPKYLVDLKAIMGDSSDNIPGILGIGPKTAIPLIQNYHTIDAIYEKLQDPEERLGMTPRMAEKFRQGEEMCRLSLDLATIRCNVPMEFSPTDCLPKEGDQEEVIRLFHALELNKLLEIYGLSTENMPEYEEKDILEHCEVQAVKTLAECTKIIDSWENQSIALLDLPQLQGLALHSTDGEKGNCLVIMENDFDFYGKFLKYLFSAPLKLIVQNSKNLYRLLLEESIVPDNIAFDVEVAAYLLNPEKSAYELETLSNQYLHYRLPQEELPQDEGPNLFTQSQAPLENMARRCAILQCLEGIFQEELEKHDLISLYYQVELPLCAVLAEIEYHGISVDAKALSLYGEKVSQMLEEVEEKIYQEAGETFNIKSTKQLGVILFEKLDFPPISKTKTGYSTKIEVLEKLHAEFPEATIITHIMEQRHLSKLLSTYVKGLQKVLSPENKIHTHFQNTVTATGRLSSVEPNLQNIPIRTELGAELRKMFVAEPGNVLIDADYSQIELRLLAHIAQDQAMLQAFQSGEDFHSQTASQVFHVPLEEVSSTMRRSAKAVNFGIVYGMSPFALSQDIGVTMAEAKNYINRYFDTYPQVKTYLEEVVTQGESQGFVTTLLGRKRWLPDLKSSNFQRRSFAQRMAQNTPIQGSAADIIKLAMISVSKKLKEEGLSGKLVLQVHDELLVQCPQEEGEKTATLVQRAMEDVIELHSLLLLAETQIGQNWGEAH